MSLVEALSKEDKLDLPSTKISALHAVSLFLTHLLSTWSSRRFVNWKIYSISHFFKDHKELSTFFSGILF